MAIINRFLDPAEMKSPEFREVLDEFERIYGQVMKKKPERYGERPPFRSKIHWSRDWEYPWAVLRSGAARGQRVLDCGCGGSPLLPYLAAKGCICTGVDPCLFEKWTPFRKLADGYLRYREKTGRSVPRILLSADFWLTALDSIRKSRDLWAYDRAPAALGYPVELFLESVEQLHFSDESFDRVYCISVVEHLSPETARQGMKEMARVLRKGGILAVTMDYDGEHVTPLLRRRPDLLMEWSGLKPYGETDLRPTDPDRSPGLYPVLGFMLVK